MLVRFSKAGTSWGYGDSAPATPDRAKPNTVVWQKKREKKNGQKADVGIRTVALKRADGENLCRVLRPHAESECRVVHCMYSMQK